MAGFTTNKKTNHQIGEESGYMRAGQGGKRHRFDLRKPKDMLNDDLGDGKDSGFGGLPSDPDGDSGMDGMSPMGPQDQEVNMQPEPHMPTAPSLPHLPHPPVAVHIHLSPSDNKAFKGMARKPRK